MKRKTMTAALAAGVLLIGSPAAVAAAPAQPMAQSASVIVGCQDDGRYAWNASLSGGPRNVRLTVYYMISSSHLGGGDGGDFRWRTGGPLYTNSLGSGSSGTYAGDLGTTATAVTVRVRIKGVEATDSDTC